MRRVLVIALLAIFAFSSSVHTARAVELKVGYIDMQKLFGGFKKMQEADAKLEVKQKQKTEERKKMVESIRRLKDEMELLSEEGKESKQAEFDQKVASLGEFDKATRGELIKEGEGILRELTKEIDDVISSYGKKHGYDMIFNKDKRILLYEQESLDITDSILRALNK